MFDERSSSSVFEAGIGGRDEERPLQPRRSIDAETCVVDETSVIDEECVLDGFLATFQAERPGRFPPFRRMASDGVRRVYFGVNRPVQSVSSASEPDRGFVDPDVRWIGSAEGMEMSARCPLANGVGDRGTAVILDTHTQ